MDRPPRREAIFRLVETARLLRTHIDQRARLHGTTRAQWGVLARLRRQEGLNQAALAEQLEMQPISLGRLLDKLEQQGLLERRPLAGDRRVHHPHLTEAGRAFVDRLDDLRSAIASEILGDLDDATVSAMVGALAGVRAGIKRADGPGPSSRSAQTSVDAPASTIRRAS